MAENYGTPDADMDGGRRVPAPMIPGTFVFMARKISMANLTREQALDSLTSLVCSFVEDRPTAEKTAAYALEYARAQPEPDMR